MNSDNRDSAETTASRASADARARKSSSAGAKSGESAKHHAGSARSTARDPKMELWFIINGMSRPSRRQQKPRRLWTADEDALLEELVAKYGARNWEQLEQFFSGRRGTHLRSHYKHALEQKDSKRPFTQDEDAYIMQEHARIGSKWSAIARRMDRRVDNDVKNRFRLLMRRDKEAGSA
mmetsp:Transcript_4267/g.11696  ORF Transcript_4267/g.11696 Transcript_4267/m.11696 type:complete len:179 (-) Transcript_4267:278-814(-)|eukprot:CAMPEP_0185831332 /NCGR_PEP_ID=MMETSP1353-20130828/1426_1 /TAXON_ID=1077150 /ORGANISM="Erythrolobus australicus, Strain CCMP3124" /LENGTH=178 /DNA_ID=CAMNT_0028529383 /DNA_START=140 /DNA_END=676 /DNA_ORIENTATION=-